MEPLLWLLLPVAAASGWYWARLSARKENTTSPGGNPAGVHLHCIQGLNYLLNDQSDKAINLLIELMDVDEDTVETHLVLGSLFRRRGEVNRAIRIHQNIIARPNLSAEQKSSALLQLGIDYLKAGLLDRAENILLQLTEPPIRKPEAFRYLRNLYEQEKEWERAIQMAERLQRHSEQTQAPYIANYYCELAERSIRRRLYEDAQTLVKKAVNTDPDGLRANLLHGDIMATLGRSKEATKSYVTALKKDPYFSPVIYKHLFEMFKGESKLDAFPDFIRRHSDANKDAAARFFLVRTYESLGDAATVESLLHDELNRSEVSPYIIKSYLEMMQGRTEGEINASFAALSRILEARLSTSMACHCTKCGFESNALFWQCPGCKNWSTVRPYANPVEYSWLSSEVT
ncbi:MAG: lipopolysaccharide assembly protein LapB [Thiotrichales bacterium]